MHKIITWFQINYPHLRDELRDTMHNFDDKDLNPYHLESDCWSHTMMVCKIAQIEEYDRVVQIAALLHDIAKPLVRRVNPKNNHVQFFGHEVASAYMSIEILKKMKKAKMITQDEAIEVFLLIALHSVFHKDKNIVTLFQKFKNYKTLFLHLVDLNRCDNLGRFCENWKSFYQKESILRVLSVEMKDNPLPNEILELFESCSNCDVIESVISELFGIKR